MPSVSAGFDVLFSRVKMASRNGKDSGLESVSKEGVA